MWLKMSLAFTVGAVYVALLSRTPLRLLSNGSNSALLMFAVPSVLIFILSRPVAAMCRTRRELRAAGGVALLGVWAGVIGNAIYDAHFNQIDHNLFPFEMTILVVLGSPGIMLGFLPSWPAE